MKPKRRRLDPDERRLELLLAAEALIRERGPVVRVEDVVARAGAAKGTFYSAFDSWDDLLEALRTRSFEHYGRLYPAPQGPVSDWPGLICSMGASFVDFVAGMGGLHEALFHSDFAQRRHPVSGRTPVARIAAVILRGQEDGAFEGIDPQPAARLLFAMIHEAADAVLGGMPRDRVTTTLDMLLRRQLEGCPRSEKQT